MYDMLKTILLDILGVRPAGACNNQVAGDGDTEYLYQPPNPNAARDGMFPVIDRGGRIIGEDGYCGIAGDHIG